MLIGLEYEISFRSYAIDVFDSFQFWRNSPVDTEKLIVYNGCQWQGIEGLHYGVVDLDGVFVIAFESKCEMFSEVSAFVIASQQEHPVWVV